MNIEQFAHDHLLNNGMFESDVKKVLELVKEDDLLKDAMQNRWNDSLDAYPSPFTSVFILSLNRIAVKYIDENIPKAWYRPIFAGGK